jgi:hypothetical protein
MSELIQQYADRRLGGTPLVVVAAPGSDTYKLWRDERTVRVWTYP